jgi:hypothetical protein
VIEGAHRDEQWLDRLDRALAASRSTRNRLVGTASLVPDLVLGALTAASGSGVYVPTSQLRRSMRRTRRRVDQGRAAKLEAWWTDSRLSPEFVTVIVRSGQAILQRQFQPEDDLGSSYKPLAFVCATKPANLPESELAWLRLHGPAGTRYLGANEMDLALIGWCAGWQYPPTD